MRLDFIFCFVSKGLWTIAINPLLVSLLTMKNVLQTDILINILFIINHSLLIIVYCL